jgi:UDP-N-acetylmuramoyl-L-alanyl-D-glutamate--2,6-diaminopimelate ligase
MSVAAMKINHAPTLAGLLHGIAEAPAICVEGIATDSRQVRQGFLFLACEGISSHGLDYLQQAIDAGACAVAWDSSSGVMPRDCDVPMIAVDGLATHIGEIANRFYGSPSKSLRTIGVTGTNGKTTVAWLLSQCLQHIGDRCAYVGTLGYGIGALQGVEGMTTPAAVELHGRLAEFADAGAQAAAIEVSSHALSQGRVDGVSFDAVLFTNLSRDHLDYHGDMQSYFESKARLFLQYDAKHKIINVDSDFGAELAARCGADVVSVSTQADSGSDSKYFVRARSVDANRQGSVVAFTSAWGDGAFTLPLPGDFNVENALLVLAYLLVSGVEVEKASDLMELLDAPPGRMQLVAAAGSPIYVDYAHTPDALGSALQALRPHCRGRLWCLFGCGGDRDSGKRAQMAAIAEQFANKVVVTTDNPRGEAPQSIIADILGGFEHQDEVTVIEDRAAAIAWVVANAAADDVVLIAGKGHESYQEINGERQPFSDHALAFAAANAKESAA